MIFLYQKEYISNRDLRDFVIFRSYPSENHLSLASLRLSNKAKISAFEAKPATAALEISENLLFFVSK